MCPDGGNLRNGQVTLVQGVIDVRDLLPADGTALSGEYGGSIASGKPKVVVANGGSEKAFAVTFYIRT